MANAPEADKNNPSEDSSEGQTLKPRDDAQQVETKPKAAGSVTHTPNSGEKRHRFAFRPTHKAMFIGLGVVVVILGINAGILGFLLKRESSNSKAISDKGVSISPGTLSKLGVNDSQIGTTNEKLVVDPSAQFNSKVTVGGDVKIGGQLTLNSTLNATTANLSQLQANSTTANSLNVNGSATASTLSVRGNFAVNGTAQFQNGVTIAQLLSVDSNAAVSGNLSVGGEMSIGTLSAGQLVVSGPIQLGSHIITAGHTPTVQASGAALGSNGSASIVGDDTAGTVTFNAGAGAGGTGPLVYVLFSSGYSAKPVVVISPVGSYADFFVANVSTSGFNIDVSSSNSVSPGGSYTVNYLVEQ